MEKVTHIPPEPAHGRGHETIDASVSGVVKFAIGLAAAIAAIALLLVWARNHWVRQNERTDPEPSPLADLRPPPPEPEIQPTQNSHDRVPARDMADLHAAWARELSTYGRVPGRDDVARIPISRAIALMSARGLPTTAPARPATTAPAATQPGGNVPKPIGGGQ